MNKFSVGQTVWAFFAPGGVSGEWAVAPGDIYLRKYEYLGECGIRCLEFGYIVKAEDCELFASEHLARVAMVKHWGYGREKFSVGQKVWACVLHPAIRSQWAFGMRYVLHYEFTIEQILKVRGGDTEYLLFNSESRLKRSAYEEDLFLTKEELIESLGLAIDTYVSK